MDRKFSLEGANQIRNVIVKEEILGEVEMHEKKRKRIKRRSQKSYRGGKIFLTLCISYTKGL